MFMYTSFDVVWRYLLNNACREWPEIFWGLGMYLDHLQNWLDYAHGLLIFILLVPFWLSAIGQISGSGHFKGNAWMEYPEIGHSNVSWPLSELLKSWLVELSASDATTSYLRHQLDLVKLVIFDICGHFPDNTWETLSEFCHANVSRPCSEMIRFLLCSVDIPHYDATLT